MPQVDNWQRPGPRGGYKLDRTKLSAYVAEHPDALLKETAAYFQVSANAVWYALGCLKISRKKNVGLQGVVTLPKAPQKISEVVRKSQSRRTKR
jgi:hypothetical protein